MDRLRRWRHVAVSEIRRDAVVVEVAVVGRRPKARVGTHKPGLVAYSCDATSAQGHPNGLGEGGTPTIEAIRWQSREVRRCLSLPVRPGATAWWRLRRRPDLGRRGQARPKAGPSRSRTMELRRWVLVRAPDGPGANARRRARCRVVVERRLQRVAVAVAADIVVGEAATTVVGLRGRRRRMAPMTPVEELLHLSDVYRA